MRRVADQNGFSLVELAVSLVVIGLLIGLGTAMVGPLMTSIKVRESRENLGSAVESVNSWASGNNRLPDATEFGSTVRTPTDAWGRPLRYLFDNKLFSPANKDTICGKKSTVVTLTDANGAVIQNVAYVILSHGDDPTTSVAGSFTTLDGTAITASAVLSVPPNPRSIVIPATSDDLVRWVTLDELRTKVGCQGAQMRVVNNELPYGYVNSPYAATISADGGFRTGINYQWCIETSQNIFQLEGGLTLNGVAGTAATNPAGVKTTCTQADAISSQILSIGGTPISTASSTSELTMYVWDDNANTANKKMVLTINPQ